MWTHMGAGGWLAMTLVAIGFWTLVALALLAIIRLGSRQADQSSGTGRVEPLQILDERLARGDISFEDYEERRGALTSGDARRKGYR